MTLTKKKPAFVTWAHGVNSIKQLHDALNSSVDMIEADIALGYCQPSSPLTAAANPDVFVFVDSPGSREPIMAHPPDTKSDLTLEKFLLQIVDYNNSCQEHMHKGVKLDFKSIDAFESSTPILASLMPKLTCPVWLNADILPGPVHPNNVIPVDEERFFHGCAPFPRAVLSVGWTTRWGSEFTEGAYTDDHIYNMLHGLMLNNIAATEHELTFPVRAGIAANSAPQLEFLLDDVNKTNKATLTIWCAPDDYVDIFKLRQLIVTLGCDRVYLDLPEALMGALNWPRKLCDETKPIPPAIPKSNQLLKLSLIIAPVILAGLWFRRVT